MDMNDYGTMPLWQNGPTPGAFYNFPGTASNVDNTLQMENSGDYGSKRASFSYNTGTSVIGMVYKNGVIIAADNLISYGSLARYRNVQRVVKLSKDIAIGSSGDYADFQKILDTLRSIINADLNADEGHTKTPEEIFNRLRDIMYSRRTKMTPYLCDVIVAGNQKDEDGNPDTFLGIVNRLGRAYKDNIIGTSYGLQLAVPMMRASVKKVHELELDEAKQMIKSCMEVLFYRDCRAFSKYTMMVCDQTDGVLEKTDSVDENWEVSKKIEGY